MGCFMKFHPVISIILGVIVSFIFYLIPILGFGTFGAFIQLFSYVIGGFIAVFYAREKKIQYALYDGLIMMLIIDLPFFASPYVIIAFFYGVSIILLAAIGGIIGLMMDENYRESFKTKYLNKGFNLIAIITGIVITFVIWVFVFSFTYLIIHPTDSGLISISLIETAELIGISVIGGFIATFMVKEKQLLNGICVGLGIIIMAVMEYVYLIIIGYPVNYLFTPVNIIVANLGYILAPTLGSYLAIITSKHQELIMNEV